MKHYAVKIDAADRAAANAALHGAGFSSDEFRLWMGFVDTADDPDDPAKYYVAGVAATLQASFVAALDIALISYVKWEGEAPDWLTPFLVAEGIKKQDTEPINTPWGQ